MHQQKVLNLTTVMMDDDDDDAQWTRPDQTTPSEVLLGTFWYQVHLACRTHKWTYTNSRNPRIRQYLRILKERVKGLDAACEV